MEQIIGPLYVIVACIGVLLMVSIIAWIYDKTRKRVEHPTLGLLTFADDSWTGLKEHYRNGEQALRIVIPGNRHGPDSQAVEQLEKVWQHLASLVASVRPVAWEEYLDVKDCSEEKEHVALVQRIAEETEKKAESFDDFWTLSQIELREEPCGDEDQDLCWVWSLEFEVAWDIEHSRCAFLDLEQHLLAYDLACAIALP